MPLASGPIYAVTCVARPAMFRPGVSDELSRDLQMRVCAVFVEHVLRGAARTVTAVWNFPPDFIMPRGARCCVSFARHCPDVACFVMY